MSCVVVLMHRIVGPVPRCWCQPDAGGELRLVIKANALNVTRPGRCYQKLFSVRHAGSSGAFPGVHDPVVLTEANARRRGGRKRSGLLDVSAFTVNLDQMKAQADLDGNRELVWSAW